jgi:hypothetical protein
MLGQLAHLFPNINTASGITCRENIVLTSNAAEVRSVMTLMLSGTIPLNYRIAVVKRNYL